VAAIALGARFTMIGRAYLYGLMAGGREGVDRTIEILGEQVARTMRLLGVDGLILSNHGGRQLDRAPIPFHLLPEVVREVGDDLEVHLDTGIMSGADIVAAVALGARFTLIGRAYLYGLMAGGREGVDRVIDILRSEIERTMRLLGVVSLDELEPAHVTQLARLEPRPR